MEKNEKSLSKIDLPEEDLETLFIIELSPAISLEDLAQELNVKPSDLENSIKTGKYENYTFEKEDNQYIGTSPDGDNFYIAGMNLK